MTIFTIPMKSNLKNYSAPVHGGAKYCDERVCLQSVCCSVSLSAGQHKLSQKPHIRTSLKFLCILTVTVCRFSFGGVAICYVLAVLWTTSCSGPTDTYRRRNWVQAQSELAARISYRDVLKLTHQGQHQTWRSLMYTISVFTSVTVRRDINPLMHKVAKMVM